MKIHFLLPALNEEANIERQVLRLQEMADTIGEDWRVVVVNDGSTDQTQQIVERLSARDSRVILENHPENRGPGQAFMTGFRIILDGADDEDLIISMDADNTHSEGTIKMMLARAEDGYEVVIASVFATGGMMIGVPFRRYVLTLACNLLYRICFPVAGIKEYTGFYRCYRVGAFRRAAKELEASGVPLMSVDGFGTAAELLVKMRRIPLFMTEVPMLVRYDQKGGKSKLRILPTTLEHIGIVAKNFLARNIFG